MKKYILFGDNNGIGGWQLYCDSRISHLQTKEYGVYLIAQEKDGKKIKLHNLAECPTFECGELYYSPCYYSDRQVKRIIDEIKVFLSCNPEDEFFVETTTIIYALWGELLAKELKCVNFVYLLHSHIEAVPEECQKFFKHKYDRDLLAGMSLHTLPDLFKGYMDMTDMEKYWIGASWPDPLSDTNPIPDEVDQIIRLKQNGCKVIGYYGSLNKPHFSLVCDSVLMYAQKHSTTQFLFVSIGSSDSGKSETYQKDVFAAQNNVVNINIGGLYPTPKKLLQSLDICIASFGCSYVAARAGVYTIRLLDDVNVIPQGIIGITLLSLPYTQYPAGKEDLDTLLDHVLFQNSYAAVPYQKPEDPLDVSVRQNAEDKVVKPFDNSEQRLDVYDTRSISNQNTTPAKRIIIKTLISCLGFRTEMKMKTVL